MSTFSTRDFLKSGLLDAVGQAPDYKVKLDAMAWLDKGYLEEDDLAEISAAIEAHKAAAEVEEPTEEPAEPEEPAEDPTEPVEA